jgi:dihydrofolate synthase/folylpolyglutamate synthase
LGSDRESIGREKAGVFRGGRPCVVAERDSPASLRATASAVGARWYGIGDAFDAGTGADGSIWWRGIDASGARVAHDALPAPRLHLDNVAAALQALALCGALPAVDVLVRELPAVGVEGRYDRRSCAGRECILDVAHNPAGMDLLRARLARDAVDGRTVAVVGAMRDKDLVAMLGSLAPAVDAWYFVDLPEPRAASAAELVEALARARVDAPVRCEAALHTALDQALAGLGAADRMVVCGSFHTVGPALDWIEARNAVHGGHS